MGLQFGVLPNAEPTSAFKILRARDRATLAINPFHADGMPTVQTGVAMITGADEAIATHQRVAEAMWRDALKGAAGATQIRRCCSLHALHRWPLPHARSSVPVRKFAGEFPGR